MERFAIAAATLVATVTFSPTASAAPGADVLKQGDLERGATTSELLSQDAVETTPVTVDGPDQARLEAATANSNALLREKLEKDAIIDIVVFEL